MKISYAIPVKYELHQLQHLITHLSDNKKFDDEIVILYDSENGHEYVEEYLRSHSVNSEYRWYERKLNDNFAEQKNYLNKLCKGDWIFQIDCDEYPDEELLENIHSIIEANGSDLELLYVPRINTVKGITREHIDKWNWYQNESGWINFPDYQSRIYKNDPKIKWVNKVHERIDGFTGFAKLPPLPEYCLWHEKSIERQEFQNKFYNTI